MVGPSLKVLSYNIHKGFGPRSKRFNLRRMKQALEMIQADVVFLQEVIGEHTVHAKRVEEWPKIPQCEFLADNRYPHFAYGKNAVYTHGHHGNAILSRYPIVSWSNHDISQIRGEKRGALHAVIELPSKTLLHCLCIHLGLTQKVRLAQVQEVCNYVKRHIGADSPLIIAGDFNDWSRRIGAILRANTGLREAFRAHNGRYARTFPSRFPLLHLDRIYYRGLQPQNSKVYTGRPFRGLSDHAALYAELMFSGAAPATPAL